MDAEYRRNQTNLRYSGAAIIVLAIWAEIKMMVFYALNPDLYLGYIDPETDPMILKYVDVIAFVLLGIFGLLILLLHVYLGRSAIRDARGEKKHRFYTIVASVVLLLTFFNDIWTMVMKYRGKVNDMHYTTYLIDITTVVALVIIVYSSHNLNRIRRQQAPAGE